MRVDYSYTEVSKNYFLTKVRPSAPEEDVEKRKKKRKCFPSSRNRAGDLSVRVSITAERDNQLRYRGLVWHSTF